MQGDECGQLGVKRFAALGIDPAAILRLEVEAPGTRGHPDFTRHAVAVDDDFAAIGKLDLDDAVGRRLKVQIRGFQRLLNMGQRRASDLVKFGLA